MSVGLESKDDRGVSWITVAIYAFALSLYFYFVVLAPKEGWSYEQPGLGQIGDFFGGVINPIVGLITVYLILTSIKIQRHELKGATEAFKAQNAATTHQSFEQTFFSWLNSYSELVKSITVNEQGTEYKGRAALRKIWEKNLCEDVFLDQINAVISSEDYYTLSIEEKATVSSEGKTHIFSWATAAWEIAYSENRHQFATLLRTLYRLIKWVDEQPEEALSTERKWHYISIIRAQLSEYELIMMLFNGHVERGFRMNKYVNRYALFDNLDGDYDLAVLALIWLQPKQNKLLEFDPFEDCAYESDEARKQPNLKYLI